MDFNLITILGPTATGKTRLGARLAKYLNGEIISADSRQVYKYMDIGTGKDLDEYKVEDVLIPYHLIDIADPTEEYNLYRFNRDFYNAYYKIRRKNKLPFLVGGSGLYLSSILQNYKLKESVQSKERINELEKISEKELCKILLDLNPQQHNITDLFNKDRIIKAILIEESTDRTTNEQIKQINALNIGIKLERDEIKKRITKRLKKRLDEGMSEEVKHLLKKGVSYEKLSFFGLEYKYVALFLNGKLNYNDMLQKLNSAIHNFAKRQMTWFRKMEREGVEINWFDSMDFEAILQYIKKRMANEIKTA